MTASQQQFVDSFDHTAKVLVWAVGNTEWQKKNGFVLTGELLQTDLGREAFDRIVASGFEPSDLDLTLVAQYLCKDGYFISLRVN